MGRKARWHSVEQLLDAYYSGIKTKQNIQSMYFQALGRGYTERSNLFRDVLDIIAKEEKEKKL